MSPRVLPPFDPRDLRDHATGDRIDRIWERIERERGTADAQVAGVYVGTNRWALGVAAAVLLAFGAGIFVGRGVTRDTARAVVADAPAAVSSATPPDILAAGTDLRAYDLPGGGRVVLSPGSTAELVRGAGGDIKVRLVQGEASFDTATVQQGEFLAIMAADTELLTPAGARVSLRKRADDVDVRVAAGSVIVNSPSGSSRLQSGQQQAIALHPLPTAVPSMLAHMPPPLAAVPVVPFEHQPSSLEPKASQPPAPDWRARSAAGDLAEALALLQQKPGGIEGAIGSARTAAELMDIHDLVLNTDGAAALRALTRIVEAFPSDPYAQVAAFKLGNIYKRQGQAERAQLYFELAQSFQGALAEDALCKRFRTASNKDDAVRVAQEYLAKYPDGRCKEEAERILGGDDPTEEEDSPARADAGADAP